MEVDYSFKRVKGSAIDYGNFLCEVASLVQWGNVIFNEHTREENWRNWKRDLAKISSHYKNLVVRVMRVPVWDERSDYQIQQAFFTKGQMKLFNLVNPAVRYDENMFNE